MSMTNCAECKAPISDTATACPQCGAKVPKSRWWLWALLAGFVLFVGYAMSKPEYEVQALEFKRTCEKLAAPGAQRECGIQYLKMMADGAARRR